jgi:predicted unusual protein kinase regulating ubiquinone biosynthesis (AarF/ABC1/UbiB family)
LFFVIAKNIIGKRFSYFSSLKPITLSRNIYNRGWRVRKAYWTAFRVVWSYFWLGLKSKIFGKKYYTKKVIQLHYQNAERVKVAILQLQGLFIKVGQLLSILTNFLPEAFQKPLEALQDQIPARPYAEIEQRIIAELGEKPDILFASFDKKPIAAASIGQAHKAVLKDGTVVIVKVQHHNIEKIAEVDLTVMEKLTRLASRFYDVKGMEYAYTQVRKMIEEELDFAKEAASMERIKANLSKEENLIIPEIHPKFCAQRVLTTTFYEGVKISDVEQLKTWGINGKELANRLTHAYCEMVFEHGFYHADPHPGNILVQQDGKIVLLDFGAVATLEPNTRTGLLELIEAAAKNNTDGIVAALKKLGFIADERQAERLSEKVIDAFRNFLQNEVEFDGLSLKDIKVDPFNNSLFNLTAQIGLKNIANTVQVPKDYVLLNRMVTLLLGICNTLDIHTNPLEVVRPYFQKFILGERGDLVKYATKLLQKTLTDSIALPNDIRKSLKQLQRGEIELKIAGEREKTLLFYLLGKQLIYAFLLIATAAFSWIFYQNQAEQLLKYTAGFALLLVFLFLRAMRQGKQVKKNLESDLFQ